jgi:hypothetical protein
LLGTTAHNLNSQTTGSEMIGVEYLVICYIPVILF